MVRIVTKQVCTYPCCYRIAEQGKSRCKDHKLQRNSTTKNSDFYNSVAWKRLRAAYKKQHMLCEECFEQGILVAAYIIDHVVELSDDYSKRLEWDNLKALCASCHNRKTAEARRERNKLKN